MGLATFMRSVVSSFRVLKTQIVLAISSHCSQNFIGTYMVECDQVFDAQKYQKIIGFWVSDIAAWCFIFSMIPTFRRVVKCQCHVYRHTNIDDILDYLHAPDLKRGAITKIARDTGIPKPTLRDTPIVDGRLKTL
jgi:hypothetical protein